MAKYDEFEQEIVEHYKRGYELERTAMGLKKIYALVATHKYGEGLRDPMLVINWDKVFGENMCPSCKDTLTLKEKHYECPKCRFKIPVDVWDEASGEYSSRRQHKLEDEKIKEKVKEQNFDDRRLNLLMKSAMEEVEQELERKSKKGGSDEKT